MRFPLKGRVILALLAASGCEAPDVPDARAGGGADESVAQERPAAGTLAARLAAARLVELTHPLDEGTVVWPTSIPFEFETVFEGWVDDAYFYASRNFCGPEHGGTHLDSPVHFAEHRWATHEIPLERLMGPAAVVDVSERAAADPVYEVAIDDLERWEAVHGEIPPGAILLLRTGWDRHWPDAEAYLGTAARGEDAVADLEFPGLDPTAARWLVEARDIVAVGIDTASLDHGPSTLFETHTTLFEANIYGLENVANLDELPAVGAVVLALPALFAGGSGGPVRIIGVIE